MCEFFFVETELDFILAHTYHFFIVLISYLLFTLIHFYTVFNITIIPRKQHRVAFYLLFRNPVINITATTYYTYYRKTRITKSTEIRKKELEITQSVYRYFFFFVFLISARLVIK